MDYFPYIILAVVVFFLGMQWRMRRAARGMVGQAAPVADAAGVRVYYFHSPSCGPCRAMTPMVARLAQEHPGLSSVDVTRQPELASHFRVMGTPTFVRVVDGRIDDVALGSVSEKRLRQMVSR